MNKRTKIIATIGPASSSAKIISELIHAGMDAVRLNFSHGERKDHSQRIRLTRQAAKKAGKQIAIILDLKGPKLRVGVMQNNQAILKRGDMMSLTTRKILGTSKMVSITYPRLVEDLKVDDVVLLDDGRLELRVLKKSADILACRVVRGGILKSNKGVNLPGAQLSLPSLSIKDKEDLVFGVKQGMDYIALSFVRKGEDIVRTRRFIRSLGADIPIIAKIEKPEAILNLEEIIHEADGIMVARGDLGVEMSPEQVPLLQKKIIKSCNEAEKPVITATQMLESMIENPQPTRAEASDVANAILDGSDCVMLSGETAIGKYPVQSVSFMTKIAVQADKALPIRPPDINIFGTGESMAHAACRAAAELQAKAIVTFTHSGSTALLVSKHKPNVPIIAATPFAHVARKISLYWGVTPLILTSKRTTDDMIAAVENAMLNQKLIKMGDMIVLSAGVPVGVAGATNMIKIHCVGEARSLERK
ncbi:MAG TPA: pyruvate kinase [Nitrospirota bacterium]|nr:pyruvate kinase [Nitrospirota bacterium]